MGLGLGLALGSVVVVVGNSAVVGSCWLWAGGTSAGPDLGSSCCWRSSGLGKKNGAFGRFGHVDEHCCCCTHPVDLMGVRMTSGLHDSLILLGHRDPGHCYLL